MDVLEHIDVNQQIYICQLIHNALKTNGLFLGTVPNSNSSLASTWRYIDWTHKSSFTEHSFDFILYNSGFKKIEIKGLEFFNKPKFSWKNRKAVKHWLMFRMVRKFRRMEMVAELGPDQGFNVPLSLNLLGFAQK